MPNYLAKSDWKSELKKRENKDVKKTGISDALDALAAGVKKNDKGKQITALETVISKAQATKKKHAALKALGRYLDSMVKDAKALEDRLSQEAAAADDSGGNSSDLAKALTKLRNVAAESPYHFVAAPGRPSTGLVVSRKQVQQKDIKAAHALRGNSGLYFTGSCWYEGGSYLFDLGPDQKPPQSLAKAIKTGAKLHAARTLQKVIVRGGGEEFDDQSDLEGSVESGEAKTVTGGLADYPAQERWARMLASMKAAPPKKRDEVYAGIAALVKRYRDQAAQDSALMDPEKIVLEGRLLDVLRNADSLLAGEDKDEGARQDHMIPTGISHGVINREAAEALLQGRDDGSWFMRFANGAQSHVISFVMQGKIYHVPTGAPQDADHANVSEVAKYIPMDGSKMVRKGDAPLGQQPQAQEEPAQQAQTQQQQAQQQQAQQPQAQAQSRGKTIPAVLSHGAIDRVTTEALLQGREDGTWLLRYSNNVQAYVISGLHQGKFFHQTTGSPQDAEAVDLTEVLKQVRLEGSKILRKGAAPPEAPAPAKGEGKAFDAKAKWGQLFDDMRSLGMIKDASTRGTKAMDQMYWGEFLDRKQHTYGRNLGGVFEVWKESGSKDNFDVWLEKLESGEPSLPGRDAIMQNPRLAQLFDSQGKVIGGKVWYMSAQERADFEARVNKGSVAGPTVANGENIFVIGPDSKLYVGQKQRGSASQQAFNHSTFFAGKPVKSAGTIHVKGGKIEIYQNLSGHYAPGIPETIRALAKISGGDRQALAGIAMFYNGQSAGSCLEWFDSVTKTEEKNTKTEEKKEAKGGGIPVSMSHGNLGSADVLPLLQGKPEGTWLIRFSTNVNQYVISIVKDGQIAHQTTKQGPDVQNLQGIPYPQNMMLRP